MGRMLWTPWSEVFRLCTGSQGLQNCPQGINQLSLSPTLAILPTTASPVFYLRYRHSVLDCGWRISLTQKIFRSLPWNSKCWGRIGVHLTQFFPTLSSTLFEPCLPSASTKIAPRMRTHLEEKCLWYHGSRCPSPQQWYEMQHQLLNK